MLFDDICSILDCFTTGKKEDLQACILESILDPKIETNINSIPGFVVIFIGNSGFIMVKTMGTSQEYDLSMRATQRHARIGEISR